ncbi:MAG: hypothetical protein Q9191_003729 [Dirinaria sp. TL-2023a]
MVQSPANAPSPREEFWLFGYGEDHRGTPEAPGRVVTLIEQACYEQLVGEHNLPPLPVYGAAYRIPPQHVAEVTAYLDIREINGYSIQYTDFYPSPSPSPTKPGFQSSKIENCTVYIGLPTNPQFLGVQYAQDVADVIQRSRGPSGENTEYLFMLESALEELTEDSRDEHVKDLAQRVRGLQAAATSETRSAEEAVAKETGRIGDGGNDSHDGREETEK